MKNLLHFFFEKFALILLQFMIAGYTQNSVTRPKHETAILDKRASFECSVKSPNAAEVEIWWQFQNENVTSQISDSHKVRSIPLKICIMSTSKNQYKIICRFQS